MLLSGEVVALPDQLKLKEERRYRRDMEQSISKLIDKSPEIELRNLNEQMQSVNSADQKNANNYIEAKLKALTLKQKKNLKVT